MCDIANTDITFSESKQYFKIVNDKIQSKELEPYVSQQEMIDMLSSSTFSSSKATSNKPFNQYFVPPHQIRIIDPEDLKI